jgi:hypothetical protein
LSGHDVINESYTLYDSRRSVIEFRESVMKRTLLAVGIAVLLSILAAPHTEPLTFWTHQGFQRTFLGFTGSRWFPAFWIAENNPILVAEFVGQTVFAAVLAAMVVNIPWRRQKKDDRD